MAIQSLSTHNHSAQKAENNLAALQSLKSVSLSELPQKYHLLAPNSMYLIASHYYNPTTWLITSKWDMFKKFDKALKDAQVRSSNQEQIMKSIDNAIQDQSRITRLKKLGAVLLNKSIGTQDKATAYRTIKTEDNTLFEHIKHCIWVAHGENPNAGLDFADKKIDEEPDATVQLSVIRKMTKLLKDGYSDCKKYSFLIRENTTYSASS